MVVQVCWCTVGPHVNMVLTAAAFTSGCKSRWMLLTFILTHGGAGVLVLSWGSG